MKNFYILLVLFLFMSSSWSQEYSRMISTGTYTVQEIQAEAEAYFAIVGVERGKGYKPYKRWEYQALRNMDENGMLKSPEFYYNELQNYNNYLNHNAAYSRTSIEGDWVELGPTTWNQTSGWNPGVGRITSLAVDESDNDHIIVGANTGGVWRTTDGGVNWTVLTDNLSNLYVYALAMDPTNTTTYFWGTSSGTIFKSIDSGATWSFLSDTGGGNVNKILIDPDNINKLYCSVEGGGIFKSVDGGSTWNIINPNATNGYDVEFKPGDTNIIYASGNEFFKSIDGGVTFSTENKLPLWTQEYASGSTDWTTSDSNQNKSVTPKTGNAMGLFYIGNFTHPISKLVSPSLDFSAASAPELKFSYTQVNWDGDIDQLRVLYKTSAVGAWIELANYTAEATSWTDITLSLPNPSSDYYIAFEGTANYARGVTLDDVTVDDATLGVIFTEGFESGTFSSGPKMIGVSDDDPSVVYILEASGGMFGALYKSTDSGDTFLQLDHTGKNYFGYSSVADDDRGQAPRDMDIAVKPSNVNEVHIAGINTWRSTDGGSNFGITSQWVPSTAAGLNIGYCHADIDIMEFVGDKLYVGSDGGVFVADNTIAVNSSYYTDLTDGLGIRQFYKIGVSQTDPEVVTGGSQDNGTSVYDTSGTWSDWLGADGMESFVDKNDSNILYGTSQFGTLYKTIDGGVNAFGLSGPDGKGGDNTWNWVVPFEQDPITQDVVYVAFDEVYKSIDGGANWTSISQNFANDIDYLKIAASDSNVMYTSINGLLYKTSDGGATDWSSLSGFSGFINSIAIHPSDPNKVAIATNDAQKVYVSTNGGVDWTSYLKDLPNFSALALVWEDNGADGLYLGMNYGVYYIDNTFATWQPFSNNLPNVKISELEINTANNKVYVATYGRGLWNTNNFAASLSVKEFELDNISLYPNPATKEINLVWNRNDDVNIKIYNSIGKLMYFTTKKSLINPLKLDASQYASGLYFVKINNANGVTTKKLIVN